MPSRDAVVRGDGDLAVTSLSALRAAESECRRCPLYQHATQVVPGEGRRAARLMLVGEQPGHQEDLAGRPFVGPAGGVLDAALSEAGIARREVFVTNAVKHFKFEMRGKRRLHKRPNAYEIERCRWWQRLELTIVRPKVVVALGATAARSLLGRSLTVTAARGHALSLEDGTSCFVTVHPSALLRIRDKPDWRKQYGLFVRDLRQAARAAG